jgi:hypothetical protein
MSLNIPNAAYPMGFMIWQIGDILGFDQQMEWIQNASFDAIDFHANPGISGMWRGCVVYHTINVCYH